jgi:ABC-type glycerol-3-phosphate transport system permease component
MSMLLNGAGVLRAQATVAVFASLSNLGLSIYLTRRLGVMGVCLGSIITQLAITFPACFFMIRNLFRGFIPVTFTEEQRVDSASIAS